VLIVYLFISMGVFFVFFMGSNISQNSILNCIGGVMVSVLASSAIACGFKPKPKIIKLVFVYSKLSTHH
jgi:hypothetical protein